MNQNHLEKLSGIVEKVTFHNEENGWTVLKLNCSCSNRIETVIVHQAKIIAGDSLEFWGNWIIHPKFGKQFKAEKSIPKKPSSLNAIEKYLGSGLIYGIGPKTAHKIVKHFKENTLDILDNDIDRLLEVNSIGKTKLNQIKTAWNEHKTIKDIMIFLQSHGISTLYSVKIFKKYGEKAIEIVSKNPYQLAKDIYGIGFFSADKIARSLGFEENSIERISAGIKHVIDSSRENGHCYLKLEQIEQETIKLLNLEKKELISNILDNLVNEKIISVRLMPNGEKYYYSNSIFYDEIYLANKIKRLLKNNINIDIDRVKKWLDKYSENIKINLSEEQYKTIINVCQKPFSIITGGPGCGKTTTTKFLVKLFEAMKKNVILTAPTGRATQRMTEVIGKEAFTIHRLLVWNPSEGTFKYNEENLLDLDVIIVDEVSMLDIFLASSLIKAIPNNAQVIFIGDKNQLPSVGPGNVLKDLLSSEKIPHFELNKIFRQAEKSKIITYAHQINIGQIPFIESPIKEKNLFGSEIDCFFIDSDDATQEQLKFIKNAKITLLKACEGSKIAFQRENKFETFYKASDNIYSYNIDNEDIKNYETIKIPEKFLKADLIKLVKSRNTAEELKNVLSKIPKYSTLNYGLTATQSIIRLITKTIPKFYPNLEIQVLCPMIRGSLGTHLLNKEIQNAINPPSQLKEEIIIGERIFRVGDKVIQTVNNYNLEIINSNEVGVFNGEIGRIIKINKEDNSIFVDFYNNKIVRYENSDISDLNLAYAITIHKSQGSEFPIVIIPILTQHFNMLFRNLIYTGLTRAKKLAIFVGSRKALAMAINNNYTQKRQTTLKYLLDND
ncbi:MAG: hypothetical protein KatS3mg068_2020 [Candidatus Sericytochromatia bacterium]|nr:MAG: hypothetical protein KatS3mg068_2020 [Candidatus Sericytochromatia bacterium]